MLSQFVRCVLTVNPALRCGEHCLCVVLYPDKLLVEMDAGIYFFINQGCLTVDNMDDPAEMQCVEVSIYSQQRFQSYPPIIIPEEIGSCKLELFTIK